MSENRSAELNTYLDAAVQKNDALIVVALGKLEDPAKRGKLKITVASVCQLTGLSRNTIRNRSWALERLRRLKQKLRDDQQKASQGVVEGIDDGDILDGLRRRIKRILEQNALLYEEILSLRLIVEDKDRVISTLNVRKLAPVTPLPLRADTLKPDLNK